MRGAAAAGRDALSRGGLAEICSVAALDGGVAPSQGRTPSCARDAPPHPTAWRGALSSPISNALPIEPVASNDSSMAYPP